MRGTGRHVNTLILRGTVLALLIAVECSGSPLAPAQAYARVGMDRWFMRRGADRDVHDVRRAAAARQDRHRQRQYQRGLLSLCPKIRRGIEKNRHLGRGARDGRLGGKPGTAGAGRLGSGGRHRSKRRGRRRDVEKFYALGSLYHEPLWVFYRSDAPIERLSQLAGKRIGVGPKGSGTHAIAIKLLALNGLIDSESGGGNSRVVIVEEDVARAAKALMKGELDAAFFVAAFEADYIQAS